MLFLLFVGSGFRIAVQADRPFSKLFAAGLTTIIGVQTFVIVGGVIRVIPLTGVTLPFISYGGSSLIANFVIVALLLRISDETVAHAEAPRAVATAAIGSGGVTPRPHRRRAGEPPDPARRLRGHRADPAARRAAHLPPGGRRGQPRQRPEQRAQAAPGLQPRPRPDPHRRRPDRRASRCRPTGDFKFQRVYPHGALFAQITGYQSFVNLVGNTGVEEAYNDVLTGQDTSLAARQPRRRLSTGKEDTNNVVLSLTETSSSSRRAALSGQKGSVVALDVKTGAVLAMYSNPTFDPTPLAGPRHRRSVQTHVLPDQQSTRQAALPARVPRALLARVDVQGRHRQVGDRRRASPRPTDPVFAAADGFRSRAPSTHPAQLRRRRPCGGTLTESFDRLVQRDVRRGSGSSSATTSCRRWSSAASSRRAAARPRARPRSPSVGTARVVDDDKPRFALAGIGQGDVFTTPLEMALVAAGIAQRRRDHGAARGEARSQNADGKPCDDRARGLDDVHAADHRRRARRA